jgi:hypothetical protein
MGTRWKDGYSAHVELRLDLGDRVLKVAQVGPSSLILREPCDLEPCFGDLIIRVDDSVEKYRVALYEGASAKNAIVRYEDVKELAVT